MGFKFDGEGSTWTEPGEGQKSGFGDFKRPPTHYDSYMERQRIPIYRGIGARSVRDLPLGDWVPVGGRACFIQLHGTEGMWGMYLVEVPAKGALNPERHLYEKVCFVVDGRGSTEVWGADSSRPHTFEWGPGSLFAVPLNARHRIINAAAQPALILVGTTAPPMFNLLRNDDFIFNCDYTFSERFDESDEDFFVPKDVLEPDPARGLAMVRTNLIPDIVTCELPRDNRRSPGYRRVEPRMANSAFYMWCGQHETGRYSKAHRHAPGAVLICLSGQGYTFTWPSELGPRPWQNGNGDKVERQDYQAGGIVSAAPVSGEWFHQHFGVGNEPLRLMRWSGPRRSNTLQGPPGTANRDQSSIDIRDGGWAIGYRDEDPYIRTEYDRMQAIAGSVSKMTDEVFDAKFEFTGKAQET